MKKNLILLLSVLCAGGLYGEEKAANTSLTPPLPEFNSEAFKQKCVLLPLKYEETYAAWKPELVMQAFCEWFEPEKKGIHLNYKGNTLHFIISYSELPEVRFNVYVVNLNINVAMKIAQELKKNDLSGIDRVKEPIIQIAKVVSGRLVVIHEKGKYRNIMRGILDNITEFVEFE